MAQFSRWERALDNTFELENLHQKLENSRILCGRKYREGTIYVGDDEIRESPGHSHAYRHFRETGHPFVVNVHSISPWGAKCYRKNEQFTNVDFDYH